MLAAVVVENLELISLLSINSIECEESEKLNEVKSRATTGKNRLEKSSTEQSNKLNKKENMVSYVLRCLVSLLSCDRLSVKKIGCEKEFQTLFFFLDQKSEIMTDGTLHLIVFWVGNGFFCLLCSLSLLFGPLFA